MSICRRGSAAVESSDSDPAARSPSILASHFAPVREPLSRTPVKRWPSAVRVSTCRSNASGRPCTGPPPWAKSAFQSPSGNSLARPWSAMPASGSRPGSPLPSATSRPCRPPPSAAAVCCTESCTPSPICRRVRCGWDGRNSVSRWNGRRAAAGLPNGQGRSTARPSSEESIVSRRRSPAVPSSAGAGSVSTACQPVAPLKAPSLSSACSQWCTPGAWCARTPASSGP